MVDAVLSLVGAAGWAGAGELAASLQMLLLATALVACAAVCVQKLARAAAGARLTFGVTCSCMTISRRWAGTAITLQLNLLPSSRAGGGRVTASTARN